MATTQRKQPKTWSLLGDVRRRPTPYEVTAAKFNYHFRRDPAPFEMDPAAPFNEFYLTYREGSPFNVDDWEGFRDPAKLTYSDYVTLQHDRETYVDLLTDHHEASESVAGLSAGWVATLRERYGLAEADVPVEALLALAGDAAHGVVRPAAPLTTYIAGLLAGRSGADAARLRAIVEERKATWRGQRRATAFEDVDAERRRDPFVRTAPLAHRHPQRIRQPGLARLGLGDAPDHAARHAIIIDNLGGAHTGLAPSQKIRAAVRRVKGMLQSHFSGSLVVCSCAELRARAARRSTA